MMIMMTRLVTLSPFPFPSFLRIRIHIYTYTEDSRSRSRSRPFSYSFYAARPEQQQGIGGLATISMSDDGSWKLVDRSID